MDIDRCWCVDREESDADVSGPIVGEAATADNEVVGDKSSYLVGHLIMGAVAMVHTILPLLLGQLWWKPKFMNDALNPWYGYSWKAMQAGGVVACGLQALLFPFTFMGLSLPERIGYILLWVVHGAALGLLSTVTVLSYFVVAAVKYTDDPVFAYKNVWITWVIYLAFQVKSFFLAHRYFKETVFYMLGTEINAICDKYPDLCKGWGLKYWWNAAWNDEICVEEENGDCSPLDSSADSL